MPLNPIAIDYFNTFDWDAFRGAKCVPGTWQNCCDENGQPFLCLGEGAALAKGAAKPCGCAVSVEDVVGMAIRERWPKADVFALIEKLRETKPSPGGS